MIVRLLLTALLASGIILLSHNSARAEKITRQEAVTRQEANEFFRTCTSTPDKRLRPETREAFCACVSANLSSNMKRADLYSLDTDMPTAAAAHKKMMINVYAPCLHLALNDLILVSCLARPAMKNVQDDHALDICECTAQLSSDSFKLSAGPQMTQILAQSPGQRDSINAVMQSPSFQVEIEKNHTFCSEKP